MVKSKGSSSSFSSTTTRAGKKRQRDGKEKLSSYGVDLPDVPGVPVELIPLLVHALKTATKFFRRSFVPFHHQQLVDGSTTTSNTTAAATTTSDQISHRDALGNILSRIKPTENKKSEEKLLQIMKDAIQSFLQALRRMVKSSSSSSNHHERTTTGGSSSSVPLSCFVYIWNLGQIEQESRMAVRRSTLCLSRCVMEKSADCRRYLLLQKDHSIWWEWIQLVCHPDPNLQAQQQLWQRESYLLLHSLVHSSQGYVDLYPRLPVAELYLRERCPAAVQDDSHSVVAALHETTTSTPFDENIIPTNTIIIMTSMTDLRKSRDTAMLYGTKEIQRIQKLVHRAHKAMDIIVPRFIHDAAPDDGPSQDQKDDNNKDGSNDEYNNTTKENVTNDIHDNADDEEVDNDDDIEWEDGADEDDDDDDNDAFASGNQSGDNSALSHAAAVERTLQLMSTIRANQGGDIQITFQSAQSFDNDSDNNTSTTTNNDKASISKAQQALLKVTRFLTKRHLPRLQKWIQGLERADSIVDYLENNSRQRTNQSSASSGGGTLLSSSDRAKREKIHQDLLEMQQLIIQVMNSVKKLNIQNKLNHVE